MPIIQNIVHSSSLRGHKNAQNDGIFRIRFLFRLAVRTYRAQIILKLTKMYLLFKYKQSIWRLVMWCVQCVDRRAHMIYATVAMSKYLSSNWPWKIWLRNAHVFIYFVQLTPVDSHRGTGDLTFDKIRNKHEGNGESGAHPVWMLRNEPVCRVFLQPKICVYVQCMPDSVQLSIGGSIAIASVD